MKNYFNEDPVGVLDDLDTTLAPDGCYFVEKPESLGRFVTFEQEAFIKFMVEDQDFLFQVYVFVDQNWFSCPELRDIVRTIKDLYYDKIPVTYNNILDAMAGRYDLTDETKEMSWNIINEIMKECRGDECLEGLDEDWYKSYFVERLIMTIPAPATEWN